MDIAIRINRRAMVTTLLKVGADVSEIFNINLINNKQCWLVIIWVKRGIMWIPY